jgi:hypothetical protein
MNSQPVFYGAHNDAFNRREIIMTTVIATRLAPRFDRLFADEASATTGADAVCLSNASCDLRSAPVLAAIDVSIRPTKFLNKHEKM